MVTPKNIFIFVLMMFALSFSVFGVNDWLTSNIDYNGNLQYSSFNTGVDNLTSINQYNYQTTTSGNDYPPAILDINMDGINELVSGVGSNLYVYNGESNNLNHIYIYTLNGTIKNVVGNIFNSVSNPSDDNRQVIILTTTNVYSLYFNSSVLLPSNLNIKSIYTIPSDEILSSNIMCGQQYGSANTLFTTYNYCAFFTNTTKLNVLSTPTNIISYHKELTDYSFKNFSISGINTNTTKYRLMISDVDNDEKQEITFSTATNLLTYSFQNLNTPKYNNTFTNFGGSIYKGYYTDFTGYTPQTASIKSIVTGAIISSTTHNYNAFNGDYSYTFEGGNGKYSVGWGYYNNSLTAIFFLDTYNANQNTEKSSLIGTLNLLNSTSVIDKEFNNGLCRYNNNNLIYTGNINKETNIIYGVCLYNFTDILSSNFTIQTNTNTLLADITGDYNSELIEYKSGLLNVGFVNNMSIPSSLTILNVSVGGGYTNKKVCQGTTLVFKSRECLSNPYLNCNYLNSLPLAQEQIKTTCGTGISYKTNGYSDYLPSVDCQYNQTGNYSVQFYLSTNADGGVMNFLLPSVINFEVINSTPGLGCNLGVPVDVNYLLSTNNSLNNSLGGNLQLNTTPNVLPDGYVANDGWNYIWSLFLGQGAVTRTILGMVLLIAVLLYVNSKTNNHTIIIISAIATIVIELMMQLISIWVIVIIGMLWLAISSFNKYMHGNSPQ
jgi:hypothetical protein